MFGFGGTELLIILVIVLIVFGAGKLPQIGSSLGRSIRSLKQGYQEGAEEEGREEQKGEE